MVQPLASAKLETRDGNNRVLTADTLRRMARKVETAVRDPRIYTLRAEALADIPRDVQWDKPAADQAKAEAITAWIQRNVLWTGDPNGIELLQSPFLTASTGAGDCDCESILWASIARAAGLTPRFVAAGNGSLSHVYTEVEIDGEWTGFDPVRESGRPNVYTTYLRGEPMNGNGGFVGAVLDMLGADDVRERAMLGKDPWDEDIKKAKSNVTKDMKGWALKLFEEHDKKTAEALKIALAGVVGQIRTSATDLINQIKVAATRQDGINKAATDAIKAVDLAYKAAIASAVASVTSKISDTERRLISQIATNRSSSTGLDISSLSQLKNVFGSPAAPAAPAYPYGFPPNYAYPQSGNDMYPGGRVFANDQGMPMVDENNVIYTDGEY